MALKIIEGVEIYPEWKKFPEFIVNVVGIPSMEKMLKQIFPINYWGCFTLDADQYIQKLQLAHTPDLLKPDEKKEVGFKIVALEKGKKIHLLDIPDILLQNKFRSANLEELCAFLKAFGLWSECFTVKHLLEWNRLLCFGTKIIDENGHAKFPMIWTESDEDFTYLDSEEIEKESHWLNHFLVVPL